MNIVDRRTIRAGVEDARRRNPCRQFIPETFSVLLCSGEPKQLAFHRLKLATRVEPGVTRKRRRGWVAHFDLFSAGEATELFFYRVVVTLVIAEAQIVGVAERIVGEHARHDRDGKWEPVCPRL